MKNLSFIDKIFTFGLSLTLCSACVSNLRLTLNGPAIVLKGGGYPFLYEMGVIIVLLSLLVRLWYGIHSPSKRQHIAFFVLLFFYGPIFLNWTFLSFDTYQFAGGGQLRLQLEVMLFGIALIYYPLELKMINFAMTTVVIAAIINGLYSIACYQGLLEPLYTSAYRVPGNIRYSGFLTMPAYIGILSAVAIAWALWLSPNKIILALIIYVCVAAVFIADSRTGMASILTIFAARLFQYFNFSKNLYISILFFIMLISIAVLSSLPNHIWYDNRSISLLGTIQIWIDNPFGIPWGSFEKVNPYLGRAVSPHNWPAIALLYGGVVSFITVVFIHAWLYRLWIFHIKTKTREFKLKSAFLLILISLTVSAWFEQALQISYAGFVYMSAAGALVHSHLSLRKHTS